MMICPSLTASLTHYSRTKSGSDKFDHGTTQVAAHCSLHFNRSVLICGKKPGYGKELTAGGYFFESICGYRQPSTDRQQPYERRCSVQGESSGMMRNPRIMPCR